MSKLDARILIIDDDADVVNAARVVLRQRFENVEMETNPERISNLLRGNRFDVILLDMNFTAGRMNGNEGLFWLRTIRSIHTEQHVVLITAYGDIKLAVEAMKSGATDFIVKPWDNDQLIATVISAVNHARATRESKVLRSQRRQFSKVAASGDNEIIGTSGAIRDVLRTVDRIANTDANVLILGENGTGKELIAKRIHARSARSGEPFVKVDVGAVSANLFESELFGHKKGAFTDAREERMGRIELASGGTLFLDEISNLPLTLQTKLLSVLQNREVTPLGGNVPVPVDIRLVTATNASVKDAIQSGVFREDLYYRINTIEITLPPLRNRPEDIGLLAEHFVAQYKTKYRKEVNGIADNAIAALQQYSWPGNIRELQHAVERAVIMSDDSVLHPEDFLLSSSKTPISDSARLEDIERDAIVKAMEKYEGNMSKVAKALGVGRTTLYRKLTKFGLDKS